MTIPKFFFKKKSKSNELELFVGGIFGTFRAPFKQKFIKIVSANLKKIGILCTYSRCFQICSKNNYILHTSLEVHNAEYTKFKPTVYQIIYRNIFKHFFLYFFFNIMIPFYWLLGINCTQKYNRHLCFQHRTFLNLKCVDP